ncbi:hypothetical protein SAMN05444344_1499 [Tenacibaculum mesophilum]|uniref:hypothetical protein n=1 Tax=Tenacibaculum mesophilum TaxID=104268 RepID=UPI0009130C69|nr:hypothetical protein [Tenacibaculum mesophilum]SHF74796.1 hypothetical protein SAMN05444344_1499 [Tenacibaculum mesophilum]
MKNKKNTSQLEFIFKTKETDFTPTPKRTETKVLSLNFNNQKLIDYVIKNTRSF